MGSIICNWNFRDKTRWSWQDLTGHKRNSEPRPSFRRNEGSSGGSGKESGPRWAQNNGKTNLCWVLSRVVREDFTSLFKYPCTKIFRKIVCIDARYKSSAGILSAQAPAQLRFPFSALGSWVFWQKGSSSDSDAAHRTLKCSFLSHDAAGRGWKGLVPVNTCWGWQSLSSQHFHFCFPQRNVASSSPSCLNVLLSTQQKWLQASVKAEAQAAPGVESICKEHTSHLELRCNNTVSIFFSFSWKHVLDHEI